MQCPVVRHAASAALYHRHWIIFNVYALYTQAHTPGISFWHLPPNDLHIRLNQIFPISIYILCDECRVVGIQQTAENAVKQGGNHSQTETRFISQQTIFQHPQNGHSLSVNALRPKIRIWTCGVLIARSPGRPP